MINYKNIILILITIVMMSIIIIMIMIIIITSRTREKFHESCSGISLRCSVLSLIKENLRCS